MVERQVSNLRSRQHFSAIRLPPLSHPIGGPRSRELRGGPDPRAVLSAKVVHLRPTDARWTFTDGVHEQLGAKYATTPAVGCNHYITTTRHRSSRLRERHDSLEDVRATFQEGFDPFSFGRSATADTGLLQVEACTADWHAKETDNQLAGTAP